MSPSRAARLAAAALLCLPPAAAQVVEAIHPEALAPGALVRVQGRDLDSVREVRFLARGGDAEPLVRVQPVLRAEGGELCLVVPSFADDPTRAVPSSPWAWLEGAQAPARPVFLLEAMRGRVRLAGAGSQRADGERLSVAFDLAGGLPAAGNAAFTLQLHGAPAGAAAFVVVGVPAQAPLLRLRDAALAVELACSHVLLGSCVTAADGRARAAVPLPSLAGITIAAQWLVDGGGAPLLSDALVVEL